MAFKFFNVGKANAEIDRLEAEMAKVVKERDELKAAATDNTNTAEIEAEAERLSGELKSANEKSSALEQQIATLNAKVSSLEASIAAKDKEVESKAAKKAADIQAALGTPSAPVPPSAKTETTTTQLSGMARILAAAEHDLRAGGYVPKTN